MVLRRTRARGVKKPTVPHAGASAEDTRVLSCGCACRSALEVGSSPMPSKLISFHCKTLPSGRIRPPGSCHIQRLVGRKRSSLQHLVGAGCEAPVHGVLQWKLANGTDNS